MNTENTELMKLFRKAQQATQVRFFYVFRVQKNKLSIFAFEFIIYWIKIVKIGTPRSA